jgi:hypothetical protein
MKNKRFKNIKRSPTRGKFKKLISVENFRMFSMSRKKLLFGLRKNSSEEKNNKKK